MRLWKPVVAVGVLAVLSLAALPGDPAPARLLDALRVGDPVILRFVRGEVTVTVATQEDLRDPLLATAEERELYERAQELVDKARGGRAGNVETLIEDLDEDLQRVRQQYGSLGRFVAEMQTKTARKPVTVSAVGADYFAYREGAREHFVPLHRITSLSRPVPAE